MELRCHACGAQLGQSTALWYSAVPYCPLHYEQKVQEGVRAHRGVASGSHNSAIHGPGPLRVLLRASLFGLGSLYIGGWYVTWGADLSELSSIYLDHGVAIRFNGSFYGLLFRDRFFDSPAMSWILGVLGVLIVLAGLGLLPDDL